MATILVTTTIQAAIDMAVTGDVVHIPTGTYNEPIVAKNGVNVECEDNVIINYTGAGGLPTLTDGGDAVVTHWYGVESYPDAPFRFFILRNGEAPAVIVSNPASHFNIFTNRGTIETTATTVPAVDAVAGTFEWMGTNIKGVGDGIHIHEGSDVSLGGSVWDGWGNVGSINGISVVMLGGNATIYGNLYAGSNYGCIAISGGVLKYGGYAKCGNIPLVQSGGTVILGGSINPVDWAFLESTSINVVNGSAILKTGGDTLTMADTVLKCAATGVESITTHGQSQGGQIIVEAVFDPDAQSTEYCYAYDPIQIGLDIVGIENLKAWPEVIIPGETQLTAIINNTKPNTKQVTLDWQVASKTPDFQVLRDNKVLGTTTKQTYTDVVKGGKPEIKYTVKNIIPTLTPTEGSITITK